MSRVASLLVLGALALAACTSEQQQDVGAYRIARIRGGLGGLFCHPRTELYFMGRAGSRSPTYLGTCGTPRVAPRDPDLPGDPSCYAISEDGTSLVYFHLPEWCGAGEKAQRKAGGVYLHSIEGGDRLLYRDRVEVIQIWSDESVEPHSIRVGWVGAKPSLDGAVCPQNLVIHAGGSERAEGLPGVPDSRCRGERDAALASDK